MTEDKVFKFPSLVQSKFFHVMAECVPMAVLDDGSVMFHDSHDPYKWPRFMETDGTIRDYWEKFVKAE